jgi:hypothetical protein
VQKLIQMEEAKIFRKTKKGFVERDIKPYISKIGLVDRRTSRKKGGLGAAAENRA